MLDVPVAIAMIAAVTGLAVGAMFTFVTLDAKIQHLKRYSQEAAVRLLAAERENGLLRQVVNGRGRNCPQIVTLDPTKQVRRG